MTVKIPTGTEVFQMLKKLGLPVIENPERREELCTDMSVCRQLDVAYREYEKGEHPPETDFLDKVKAWIRKR